MELTRKLKLLSDDTRLRILVLLHERTMCICEICSVTGIDQPKVSKHMAKLRAEGLVSDERKERYIYYSLSIENNEIARLVEDIHSNMESYPLLASDYKKLKLLGDVENTCGIVKLEGADNV